MIIGYSIAFTTNADAGINQFIGSFNYLSCSGRWA